MLIQVNFSRAVSVLTSAQIEFGVIPHDHWYQPDWIDEDKATKARDKMIADNIIYGGSVSYRNMCRFNSGVSSYSPNVYNFQLNAFENSSSLSTL